MDAENLARIVVYSSLVLPCLLFVAIYVWLLPRLRARTESYHVLAFTSVVGYIAADFLMGVALNWWEFSVGRFLGVLGIASLLLWQRLFLLVRYNVMPRVRRRREMRNRVSQPVD